jgi:hypothetical protein
MKSIFNLKSKKVQGTLGAEFPKEMRATCGWIRRIRNRLPVRGNWLLTPITRRRPKAPLTVTCALTR